MSGYHRDLTKLENTRNCLHRIARHDELQFSKDSIVNVMEKFVKTVKVMDDTILIPCRLMDRQVGDSSDNLSLSDSKNATSNQHTSAHSSSCHSKRGSSHSKNVHEFLHSAELFNLYNMLKVLKNDLLWTGKDTDDNQDVDQGNFEFDNLIYARSDSTKSEAVSTSGDTESRTGGTAGTEPTNAAAASITTTNNGTVAKGHNRRPSTASLASTVSVVSVSNMSDSESELSNENDSGVESEGNKSDNQQSSSESVSGSEDAGTQTKKAANVDKATDLAQRCRRHLNGLYQCLEQMTEAANYLTARYQSDIGTV